MMPDSGSLQQLANVLANRETDAIQMVLSALDRARASKGIFISLRDDEAMKDAQAAVRRREQGWQLGPLDGIPIALKDNIDMRGTVTTSGSRTLISAPSAERDSGVVASLRRHGMIVIGKTNLSEFAFSGLGLNEHFGTPAPALDDGPRRIPGGSSSGSALAVGEGIVAAAIGTDTAGSIRIPAAFNGLVGYRGSIKRYNLKGVRPLAPSLDSLGPITNSVTDCVLLDQVMRGRAARIPAASPLADMNFVVDADTLEDPSVQDVVREHLLALMQRLSEAGACVKYQSFRPFGRARQVIGEHGWLGAAEAWFELGAIATSPSAHLMDRRVRARLIAASRISSEVVAKIRQERAMLISEMEASLSDAILVTPTVGHVAPEFEPLENDDALFAHVNMATLSLTMPLSLLDAPGLALPCQTGKKGLSTSALFSGPSGADDRLLRAGLAIEKALNRQGGTPC